MTDTNKDHGGADSASGGMVAARTRDSIAAKVNPTEYRKHFRAQYKNTPYYTAGRTWSDYEPAYRYGYETYERYRDQRFDDVDRELQRSWDAGHTGSRLEWSEAKQAVRDVWHHIERRTPGEAHHRH